MLFQYDLVATRNPGESKQGTKGTPIPLFGNYFGFQMRGDRLLLQYRVDINIDEDRTCARKSIVKRIKDKIPAYLFDGTIMHTMERIFPEADGKSKEFDSQTDDGQFCKVILKMVGEVQPTDHHYLQVYNIIMRRMMETLDLQELRRNYYDANASILIPQYNLEVWPGYITSIRQHEHEVLMVTEIDHKILRTDTALRQMNLIMDKTHSQDAVKKGLIGCIVMTRYNKKTYRVDDIDFALRVTCKRFYSANISTHAMILQPARRSRQREESADGRAPFSCGSHGFACCSVNLYSISGHDTFFKRRIIWLSYAILTAMIG